MPLYRYYNEVKQHQITKIKLRNVQKGLEQEQLRNKQLEQEIQDFYKTLNRFDSFQNHINLTLIYLTLF